MADDTNNPKTGNNIGDTGTTSTGVSPYINIEDINIDEAINGIVAQNVNTEQPPVDAPPAVPNADTDTTNINVKQVVEDITKAIDKARDQNHKSKVDANLIKPDAILENTKKDILALVDHTARYVKAGISSQKKEESKIQMKKKFDSLMDDIKEFLDDGFRDLKKGHITYVVGPVFLKREFENRMGNLIKSFEKDYSIKPTQRAKRASISTKASTVYTEGSWDKTKWLAEDTASTIMNHKGKIGGLLATTGLLTALWAGSIWPFGNADSKVEKKTGDQPAATAQDTPSTPEQQQAARQTLESMRQSFNAEQTPAQQPNTTPQQETKPELPTFIPAP